MSSILITLALAGAAVHAPQPSAASEVPPLVAHDPSHRTSERESAVDASAADGDPVDADPLDGTPVEGGPIDGAADDTPVSGRALPSTTVADTSPDAAATRASPVRLALNPTTGFGARSVGMGLAWLFGSLAPIGTVASLELAVSESVWLVGAGSLSAGHQLPIGAAVNVVNNPHVASVSSLVRAGGRYVFNPGDVVELFSFAGLKLGLSSAVTKRDIALWELVAGSDDPSLALGSSLHVGGSAGVGAEIRLLDRLRLRFASPLVDGGASVSQLAGGDLAEAVNLTRYGLVGGWFQIGVRPTIGLHLRF